MASVLTKPLLPLHPRLLTAADLAAMPSELPSGPVKYELDDGRLVLMAPAGETHSSIQSTILYLLRREGQSKGHGKAFVEVGVILRRNPDRVVGPDVAFISKRSLPVRKTPEDYLETIPELVVEIRSKNDSPTDLRHKAEEYLQAGALIVWIVEPKPKSVTVYCPNQRPRSLQVDDLLTAKGVFPGFKVAVAEIFGE